MSLQVIQWCGLMSYTFCVLDGDAGGTDVSDLDHAAAVIDYGIAHYLNSWSGSWARFRFTVAGLLKGPCHVDVTVQPHHGVTYSIRESGKPQEPRSWTQIVPSNKPYTQQEIRELWRKAYRRGTAA